MELELAQELDLERAQVLVQVLVRERAPVLALSLSYLLERAL